jgi:hypothetical protein
VPRLASAIRKVIADPASAWRRAIAARRRVETGLSFAERTRRLERIYDDLVVNRASRRPSVERSRIGALSA